MWGNWLKGMRRYAAFTCAMLLAAAGVSRAGDSDAELRAMIEEQGRQIQALKKQLEQGPVTPVGADAPAAKPALDENAVKNIVGSYLHDNPGAGMPAGVQTGYAPTTGFVIRSAPDPKYVNWDDDCKVPFELRIRGRIQLDYYNYRVTDPRDHRVFQPLFPKPGSGVGVAQFSQEEIKRMRINFGGTVFTPDLRYFIELDGNTRGLGGFQNNKVFQTAGAVNPAGNITSPNNTLIGAGVTVDHAVRLFQAWMAYDFHPCGAEKGCGPDCPDGTVKYAPTFTLLGGKLKPFFCLDEFVGGSARNQFIDYSMADWMFNADDDNLLMGAGYQIKAMDDRFFMQGLITNGSESQFPNTQMDEYPGLNIGWWYDFGGNWNDAKKKWDLYGDTGADLDYSCNPVVRVGSAINFVPMDRRSLYGDLEQSRFFVTNPGPGGTRLINVFNGDTSSPAGSHAVDYFDAYTFDVFASGKWRGFSLTNEWWCRDLNDFHTTPSGRNFIVYQDTGGHNSLFERHALLDYGMQLEGGYFIIPKKLEVVARWSWISGDSGDVNGNGTFHTVTVPGITGPVRVINGAFHNNHEADEYAIGVNYYFKGHFLKWQTDLGWYRGSNPAGGGASPDGFITGQDGWMLRTQLQLAF
jgi:hypothetical protein